MTAQHSQNKVFVSEVLHFCSFAATPTNTQNDNKMNLKITKSDQIGAGGFPKAMPKTIIKIDTMKMHKNQIWEQIYSKITSQTGLRKITFSDLFGHLFPDASGMAPGPAKS